MLEPDRKNGMLIAERSNAELYITLLSILSGIGITGYDYYVNGTNVWYWWIFLPIASAAVLQYILQITILPIAEKRQQNSEIKKYYFRSGVTKGSEKYNQHEKDQMDKLQNEEPILFRTIDGARNRRFYYRFENRTWVSDKKLDLDSVKNEIKAYLKMKNI